jgi:hypothetical protein
METTRLYFIWVLFLVLLNHFAISQRSGNAFEVKGLLAEAFKTPFGGGMNACQFGAIDLNIDGIDDLVVFDRQGNRIMPYINGGTAGTIDYTLAPEYVEELPELFHWVIFADYNMDGKADIFTYNPQFPGIIVYKNTSVNELRFELVVYPYLTSWYGSGYVNILVTYADYPGISDIDGDGDLDILTFWALGSFVEMHKNLSMEMYGNADSLIYERTTSCWGNFAENEESNTLYLDTCFGVKISGLDLSGERERHTGSTLLLRDLNNDNTKDLLLGDVDYPQLVYLLNDGTTEDAHISSYNLTFPNEDYPSWIYSMPAAAMIDVNNDGADDLLVSPFDPNPFINQNFNSVWMYRNDGSNEIPEFTFRTKRFLQADMIDVGSGAYPTFADINLDGLQELIIGNYGYYQSSWYDEYMILHTDNQSRMSLFLNDGLAEKPAWSYTTDNFGLIAEMNILGTYPSLGDVDSDEDADMIVGRDDGTLLFYRNCSCLGNPDDFQLEEENYMGIDVGDFSTPFLYDIDEDGLIDLIIGERGGNLNFYKNTGDINEPNFTFVTDSLGGVLVTDFNVSWDGYSTPYVFRAQDGLLRIISGSEQGDIYYYTDIEGNLIGDFERSDDLWTLIDSVEFNISGGYRTAAAIADLNADGYLDMAVGNFSGGLNLYSNGLDPIVNMDITDHGEGPGGSLRIYPNPASTNINIMAELADENATGILQIINMQGIMLYEAGCKLNVNFPLSVGNLTNGVYICILRSATDYKPKAYRKFIIQH